MYVAKTKALISCAVTTQLKCAFVFAYAKRRFSYDAALIKSKKISNDQELIQSNPTSCPINQKGNNLIHK